MAGEIVHIEFPSADADRAQAFWGGLFGWEFGAAMEGMDYRMARTGENSGAAVFPAEERSDATGAFRLVGFGQDALFVLGGEATALGLGDDLRVGVGVRFGAGFAASGTPVALASLGLPTCHRQQSRWRRRGNLMVVHV